MWLKWCCRLLYCSAYSVLFDRPRIVWSHTSVQSFFPAVAMEILPANRQQRPAESIFIFADIWQKIITKMCCCSYFRLETSYCSLLLFILSIFWTLYSLTKIKSMIYYQAILGISYCSSLTSWPACLYLYLLHLN